MTTAALMIGLTAAALTVGVVRGARHRSIFGAVVALQCAYWGASYVVRPLILLLVQPQPRLGDPVADPRMAELGYENVLAGVLGVVAVGVCVYVVAATLVLRRSTASAETTGRPVSASAGAALIVLGWLARLASIALHAPVFATLALLGSIGTGVLILWHLHRLSRGTMLLAGSVLVVSELLWSLASASKAPVFACGLFVLVVVLRQGVTRRSATRAALVGVGLVLAFPLIQASKAALGMLVQTPAATASYPAALHGLMPFVRRFDLVSAVTDAYLAGPASWMSPVEAVHRAAAALVPSQLQLDKGDNTGALWAVEVRAVTVPGSNTGVHLAEGPIAEGYVIGGLQGVILESLLLLALTALVAWRLTRGGRFGVLFALAMTCQPFLFERGVLGAAEGLGKALQVSAVAVVLVSIVSLLQRGRGPGTGATGAHGRARMLATREGFPELALPAVRR
ncbi:MAG TPA: hypothetical protein VGK35_14260 [Actinotalea sp.]|jgi:hypothetical protein